MAKKAKGIKIVPRKAEKPSKKAVVKKEEGLSVKCNCQAGTFGKLCKHKLSLLSGDSSLLFDKNQLEKLNSLQELLKENKIKNMASQLLFIKSEIEQKKKEEGRIKKLIEREIK